MVRDWRDAERLFPRPAPELGRLVKRARHRVGIAIVLALALSAAAVSMLVVRAAKHEAQIILRVSEGTISDGAGMPRGELRGYIEDALLRRETLLEIVESEALFPSKRDLGDQYAIEELRRALDIEIYGNFFATWRRVGPRSARIRVTYRSDDRREATAVVRALARRIEAAELAHRRRRFAESTEFSQSVIERAEQRLDARQEGVVDHLLDLRRAEGAGDRIRAGALRLKLWHLSDAMEHEQRTLRDAQLGHRDLEFRRDAASQQLGILFTVVDEIAPPRPPSSRWLSLAAVGGLVFVLGLPLAGIAAGAFDGRLHEEQDIARLGLPSLGHVPSFPGHRLGAIRRGR